MMSETGRRSSIAKPFVDICRQHVDQHLEPSVAASHNGRDARDTMLGLTKTCRKLKLSFHEYLGSRLGMIGTQIPPLAELIRPAPS
jgi:hypothetical protein